MAKKSDKDAAAKSAADKTEKKSSAAKKSGSTAKPAAPKKTVARTKAAPESKKEATSKGSAIASVKQSAKAKSTTGSSKSTSAKPTKSVATKGKPEVRPAPAATRSKSAAAARTAVSSALPANQAKTPLPISRRELLTLEEKERELPLEYGDTKIVLMVRDPEWIFAYWEISSASRKMYRMEKGKHNRPLLLRIHPVGGQSAESFDVPVNDYTSSWYVRVPTGSRRFRADLGTIDDKGGFQVIAQSNEIALPNVGISQETDVQFAEINDEIYSQIVHLSGGLHIRQRLGSEEFLRSLQARVFEAFSHGALSSAGLSSGAHFGLSSGVLGGSSGLLGGWLSSGALSSELLTTTLSSGALGGGVAAAGGDATGRKEQKGDFWLEVGVDVIVYGATEPDAKVTFMGQEIRLTPDGTFRVRMVLPDSKIEFPIEATSNDGKHRRAVKPVVKRHTEGDPRKPL